MRPSEARALYKQAIQNPQSVSESQLQGLSDFYFNHSYKHIRRGALIESSGVALLGGGVAGIALNQVGAAIFSLTAGAILSAGGFALHTYGLLNEALVSRPRMKKIDGLRRANQVQQV